MRQTLFAVVTGDIRASRGAPDRSQLQRTLRQNLREVSRRHQSDLATPFVITLGDEFQGVVNAADQVYRITLDLERQFYPVRLTFGVGIGRIETRLGSDPREMDGEAFRLSREALAVAKKEVRSILVRSGRAVLDAAVNTILLLLQVVKSDWQEIHIRRVWLYEKLGTLGKVAETEGVSIEAVRKSLEVSSYEEVHQAETTLQLILKTYSTPEG